MYRVGNTLRFLPSRRNDAELLQLPDVVSDAPVLGQLAFRAAHHLHHSQADGVTYQSLYR